MFRASRVVSEAWVFRCSMPRSSGLGVKEFWFGASPTHV